MRLLLKSFRNVSRPLRVQMHCRLAESTLCLQGIPQFNRWSDLLAILNKFLPSIQSVISHHYLFQSQPNGPCSSLTFKVTIFMIIPLEYLLEISENHPPHPSLRTDCLVIPLSVFFTVFLFAFPKLPPGLWLAVGLWGDRGGWPVLISRGRQPRMPTVTMLTHHFRSPTLQSSSSELRRLT